MVEAIEPYGHLPERRAAIDHHYSPAEHNGLRGKRPCSQQQQRRDGCDGEHRRQAAPARRALHNSEMRNAGSSATVTVLLYCSRLRTETLNGMTVPGGDATTTEKFPAASVTAVAALAFRSIVALRTARLRQSRTVARKIVKNGIDTSSSSITCDAGIVTSFGSLSLVERTWTSLAAWTPMARVPAVRAHRRGAHCTK